MARSFKNQVLKDQKRVFLSLDEFGDLYDVEWRRRGGEVLKLKIQGMIDKDTSKPHKANRHTQSRIWADVSSFSANTCVLYASLEDFGEVPKRNEMLIISGIHYTIKEILEDCGAIEATLEEIAE